MKTLETLLEITVYSGVLLAAILLLKLCLKGKMSPFLHFALWGLLIARLLIPITAESSVHLFTLPAQGQTKPAAQDSSGMPAVSRLLPDAAGANEAVLPQKVQTVPESARMAGYSQVAPPTRRTEAITAERVLLMMWLSGVAAGLLYLALLYCVMRRKITRSAAPPSRRLLGLLDDAQHEMGIRAHIKLVCQYEYCSPALLFPNTVLMPLDMLVAMDDGQVKLALRHELTHYKRKDHITGLLLSVLNAVYWFNPVVWIAFPLIRADMETACDSAVVRRMDSEQKSRYASLIVSLFARPAHRRLALGMAHGVAKRMAERRVKGIFMGNKSGKGVKLASAVVAVALLVACFTTACQPTPTKPVVVQKDQDKLLQTATPQPTAGSGGQTAAPVQNLSEQVGAPQSYQKEIELAGGKLVVSADAAVWAPDASVMPVVRVTAADFTQQQVNGLIKALFGNRKLYEIRRGKLSKKEIDEQIVANKKRKLDPEYSSDADQASLDATIDQLQEARKTAPDNADVQIVESDGTLRLTDSLDQYGNLRYRHMGLSVTNAPNTKKDIAWLTVQNNNDLKETLIEKRADGAVNGMTPMRRNAMVTYHYYTDMDQTVDWGYNDPISVDVQKGIQDADALKVLRMTPDQALQKARDFLQAAGISDMAVRSVSLITDSAQGVDGKDPEHGHYAYYLQFNRVISGLPCAYLTGNSGVMDIDELFKEAQTDANKMKYAGFWHYETMYLALDDSGILSLNWSSPLAMGETLNAQAVLLPFPEIARRFEEQMRVTYEPKARQNNIKAMRFQIADVRLELQRISEKDSFETGLLVPVWNFYGTAITQQAGDTGDGQPEQGLLMTINAVDGSVIDPEKGY